MNSRVALSADSGVGEGELVRYAVQLRSALPIREAIVRQLQFDQKYDKKTDVERSEFDAQAGRIVDRSYDDQIVVHVDFAGNGTGASGVLGSQRYAITGHKENLRPALLGEDGVEEKAIRVDVDPAAYTFDVIFPRLVDGTPVVKNGQKQVLLRFLSPLIGLERREVIPAQSVK